MILPFLGTGVWRDFALQRAMSGYVFLSHAEQFMFHVREDGAGWRVGITPCLDRRCCVQHVARLVVSLLPTSMIDIKLAASIAATLCSRANCQSRVT